jgi:3-methyladenine DNA glycosylase AlkD
MTPSAAAILERMRALGSPAHIAGRARFGIQADNAYGVSLSDIRAIAREHRRQHALALELYDTGIHEARLLAIFIADPARMTGAEMEHWVRQFASWDVCDGCATHLFRKTPLAWKKAQQWSRRKPEFVRRAGFTMMAVLAVHDKQAPDQQFIALLPLIEGTAADDRNFVKKAVNWALRQIGKRNARLRQEAIAVARRLAQSKSPSARWVGRDALREFARIKPLAN